MTDPNPTPRHTNVLMTRHYRRLQYVGTGTNHGRYLLYEECLRGLSITRHNCRGNMHLIDF